MHVLRRNLCRLVIGALLCVSVGCSAPPPQKSQPAAPVAPASAAPVLEELKKDWQEQKDSMMKIADAMPEPKFGYKSTPPQRSYGEQIMHVVIVNAELLKTIGGKAPAPAVAEQTPKAKSDILKALADSYDYGIRSSAGW